MSLPMPAPQPTLQAPEPTNVVALPIPMIRPAQDGDWRDRGACVNADPETFFPEKGSPSREAKRTCNEKCTVREECLEYALQNDERFGIWGGLSTLQRKKLLQARQDDTALPPANGSSKRASGGRPRTTERDALIRKLRAERVSPRDIAKKFDVSLNTVYRVCGGTGKSVSTRSTGAAAPENRRA